MPVCKGMCDGRCLSVGRECRSVVDDVSIQVQCRQHLPGQRGIGRYNLKRIHETVGTVTQ